MGEKYIVISVYVCMSVFPLAYVNKSSAVAEKKASDFARWFIVVLGRKSPILWNFAPPEAPP